jgi:hypothetical protein
MIMTIYDPPHGISPAMLRFVWKQVFDDRVVWSILLSLVARGLATIRAGENSVTLHATRGLSAPTNLPKEEKMFLDELSRHHRAKGITIPMMDGRTAHLVIEAGDELRKSAVGKWFNENREFVIAGTALSALALCIVAMPNRADQFFVLVASFALMAPGAFYLTLLILRIRDLFRAAHRKMEAPVLGRIALLITFLTCCLASIFMGSTVLGITFGWSVVAVAIFFACSNLVFLHLMRAPTAEGRKLLDEIEGFREFLRSVEQLPMDRSDSPGEHAGAYERYLPYAVALEVEQAWSDRFVALSSSFHEPDLFIGAESLYLGMWNGKPVQVVYKAEPTRR